MQALQQQGLEVIAVAPVDAYSQRIQKAGIKIDVSSLFARLKEIKAEAENFLEGI